MRLGCGAARAPAALQAAAAALRLPLRVPPYLTSTQTSGAPCWAKCAATVASVLASVSTEPLALWRWLIALSTDTTILPRMRKEGMWPKPPALKKKCSLLSPTASAARQRQARESLAAATISLFRLQV